jgi:hypothetical protein
MVLHSPGIDAVEVAIADIAMVDLQLAERQLPQPRQRRIAGAKIVERQRAIELTQLVGDVVGDLEIVERFVLGDFGMRPGQVGARGRSSRKIRAIGSLKNADTGTLTESFTEAPSAAQSSKSRSAVRMTRSVKISISSSMAPGRNSTGGMMLSSGRRARTRPAAPTSRFERRSILGWYQSSSQLRRSTSRKRDFAVSRPGIGPGRIHCNKCTQSFQHGETILVIVEFAASRGTVDTEVCV